MGHGFISGESGTAWVPSLDTIREWLRGKPAEAADEPKSHMQQAIEAAEARLKARALRPTPEQIQREIYQKQYGAHKETLPRKVFRGVTDVADQGYGPAKEELEISELKLVPRAERARAAATGLVRSDEWFECYLSPFEALQIEEVGEAEFDIKAIQRAKKRLLQEIELNDGKISWLDDHTLDKSRVHKLDDELLDPTTARCHRLIFQNKPLLRFLTRGDIEHFLRSDEYLLQARFMTRGDIDRFLYSDEYFLQEKPEFRTFLSKPFARQYNVVLTRAIERRLLPVVEVLFDGRRWVLPEDEDICFEGADRRIGELVQEMQLKAKTAGPAGKVRLGEIEGFLRQHSLPELFNLLSPAFVRHQTDVIAAILGLAIAWNNEHRDYDLSKGVLSLCRRFTCRSVELTKRIERTFQTIEENIFEERAARERAAREHSLRDRLQQLQAAQSAPDDTPSKQQRNSSDHPRNQKSSKKMEYWGQVFGFPIFILTIWFICRSCDSPKTAPRSGSNTPPWNQKLRPLPR